jgi:dynein heavy chain
MTLTGALHLNYGGNPQGPAGTGKTETTKDLGKALAICTIVFNCSDELTYKMMERYFMGLASQGAWSCFDEFNRIGIEVLSVIAQQMLTIQTAVRAKAPEFEFCGRTIPLNLKFGVFITMNPGYAGRQELPDNLKALFRPVSMMIPNYALIAEITLYSEGFMQAKSLSEKMARLYSLSSEQLSKQKHYDFGMRAVKTVLVMAGKIKRQDRDTPEEVILIRAMRDSNVPKFLVSDLPLFFGIIQDLFPTTVVPFIDYGKLQLAVENELRKEKKQIVPDFIKKIIQLLETMIIRHGNMIVGSTGTGKTTVSRILMKALTQNHLDGVVDANSAWYKPVKL